VNLTSQAGQPYDAYSIRKDVRALWSTGRFDDIRVETAPSAGGISIIFRVTEAPRGPRFAAWRLTAVLTIRFLGAIAAL
jgi:outer membrane protein assembly factor BamA